MIRYQIYKKHDQYIAMIEVKPGIMRYVCNRDWLIGGPGNRYVTTTRFLCFATRYEVHFIAKQRAENVATRLYRQRSKLIFDFGGFF